MARLKFLSLLLALLGWEVRADEIRILARVGPHVISDRQVALYHFLQNPESFKKQQSSISDSQQRLAFEQLLTQHMVLEESRISGGDVVSDQLLQHEFLKLRNKFGPLWIDFLRRFDVSEENVKDLLKDMMTVDQAIASRVKVALQGQRLKDKQRLALIEKTMAEWIQQLKLRYRVKYFGFQNDDTQQSR